MKKKIESLRFHMFEIPQLCEHFQAMAKQGWMLYDYVGGSAFYRKEEPQNTTFIIHIASDYYVFSFQDKPSSKDQDFVTFAQEYGFENVCSHSAYQVYKSKDTQGISFYGDSFHNYLKEYKPHVIKYEFWRSILPALGILCLCIIPLFRSPSFFDILDNRGILVFYVLPYLLWLFPTMLLYPIIHKMIAKENYQTDIASIQLRSYFITNILPLLALPYVLAPFPFLSIIIFILLIFIFTRTITRYACRKLTNKVSKTSILIFAYAFISLGLYTFLSNPYQNETLTFSKAYVIHHTESSILTTTYDLTREEDAKLYRLTIIQNQNLRSDFIKLISNEGIESEVRWNIWNAYLMMDGSTYLLKDNKILWTKQSITDVETLQQLLLDFQM